MNQKSRHLCGGKFCYVDIIKELRPQANNFFILETADIRFLISSAQHAFRGIRCQYLERYHLSDFYILKSRDGRQPIGICRFLMQTPKISLNQASKTWNDGPRLESECITIVCWCDSLCGTGWSLSIFQNWAKTLNSCFGNVDEALGLKSSYNYCWIWPWLRNKLLVLKRFTTLTISVSQFNENVKDNLMVSCQCNFK